MAIVNALIGSAHCQKRECWLRALRSFSGRCIQLCRAIRAQDKAESK